jgi:Starch-binding associating with outer membrane
MKATKLIAFTFLTLVLASTSCSKFESLEANPNAASETATVPPSYLLGRILFELYQGPGVTDGVSGNTFEGAWGVTAKYSQHIIPNDSYYGIGGDQSGGNYTWSNTATPYNLLKLVDKMELQAAKFLNPEMNSYKAIGKFIKAYVYVWLTQRVGDIPTEDAGQGLKNLTPVYTSQKDVYAKSLQLLEDANADLNSLIPTISTVTNIEGDIFYGNNLKSWQKAVNTFKLRVLISLSKRADDTPELGIKQKFADVLANPTKYPVLTGNTDNLKFSFNSQYNPYPLGPTSFYNNRQHIGSALMSLLTSNKDPRTFLFSTPAPGLLKAGKLATDFDAYAGASAGATIDAVKSAGGPDIVSGPYSFISFVRYYQNFIGPEPYVIIGYPEMLFNIAEAANRGWITADAGTNYLNGVKASLAFYNLKDGDQIKVGDVAGGNTVNVTAAVNTFLTNIAYVGNTDAGLKQIIEQKYVAFFVNSGWEPFYNWRRTGYPSTFATTGSGINGSGKIPMRWLYPVDETTYNSANASAAIQGQFGGTDDLNKMMWLLK